MQEETERYLRIEKNGDGVNVSIQGKDTGLAYDIATAMHQPRVNALIRAALLMYASGQVEIETMEKVK